MCLFGDQRWTLELDKLPLGEGHQRFVFACRSSRRCPHRGWWRRPPDPGLRQTAADPAGRSPPARTPDHRKVYRVYNVKLITGEYAMFIVWNWSPESTSTSMPCWLYETDNRKVYHVDWIKLITGMYNMLIIGIWSLFRQKDFRLRFLFCGHFCLLTITA